jgi:arylsulfatase
MVSNSRRLTFLTVVLGLWLLADARAVEELAGRRPNILFILADDTGYGDLGATGNPILKTPHTDKLYREAVRFTDFHVSPTCAPTRAALLTGRHEFKDGVTHTILERERLTLDATTLAEVLKRAGYTTGIFGKWHLGDEPDHWPSRRGFDEMFIHGGGGIGQTYPGSCGDAPGNKYFDPTILHNGTFTKTHGFCTDIFAAQAAKWMESVKGKQPFFCYLPFNAAHDPLSCPEKYREPYVGKVKPDYVATFLGMCANIDENVGMLMAKLDEWGIAKDTLVIYMNDNGGDVGPIVYNAGMRGKKNTPWLGGTRAASLWRWPNALEPHDVDALCAHIDFFPTLAELAGATLDAKTNAQVEGRSLVPMLRDAHAAWPERTLFTHCGRWPQGADPAQFKYNNCSVRNGRWHLVCIGPPQKPQEKNWQLFDVKVDAAEKKNVAAQHPEIVAKLDEAYTAWWNSVVPMMVNEKAVGPATNPFKELYWKQFGGPGPNNAPRPAANPTTDKK